MGQVLEVPITLYLIPKWASPKPLIRVVSWTACIWPAKTGNAFAPHVPNIQSLDGKHKGHPIMHPSSQQGNLWIPVVVMLATTATCVLLGSHQYSYCTVLLASLSTSQSINHNESTLGKQYVIGKNRSSRLLCSNQERWTQNSYPPPK